MRQATRDDLLELLRMGREFANAYGTPIKRDTLVESFEGLIASDVGTLIITEGGMIGGVIYPLYFNDDIRIAQELFWWVDERVRGNSIGDCLLSAFEAWAIENGANRVSMVALHALKPRKVGEIYKGRGYKPLEHSYIKEF